MSSIKRLIDYIEGFSLAARTSPNRIVAFDIIRGFFLAVILIDHIELYPSGFDIVTGRGILYVSAAEGFFFMSGLLVGLVYRRRIAYGMRFIFKKMWTRALELYAASVALTLLFTVAAINLRRPSLKYGLPTSPVHWPHIIGQTFLMRYGYGWTDFLDRFAILMFLAPLGFYLIAKGRWKLLMIVSFIVWGLRGVFTPYDFTVSWQLLFLGAMVIGFHWQRLAEAFHDLSGQRRRRIKKAVAWISAATFAISYASVFLLTPLNNHYSQLTSWAKTFTDGFNSFNAWIWLYAQKWTLGPIRIILFLFWFWTLFMLVQKYLPVVDRFTKGIFDLLGTNSLFVYIAQGFIVFSFKLFIPAHTNFGENFIITLAALVVLVGLTVLYKKHYPVLASKKAHLYQKMPWVPANVES